jgi:hypothetical protein
MSVMKKKIEDYFADSNLENTFLCFNASVSRFLGVGKYY